MSSATCEDVVHVVADQDDAEAAVGEPAHQLAAPARSGRRPARRSARRGSRAWSSRAPRGRWRRSAAGRRRGWRPAAAPTSRCAPTGRRGSRAARCSIVISSRTPRSVQLAAEEQVLDDVEVVAQREVLVDDLDAERVGLLGVVHVTGWPSKGYSPLSKAWMPAMPLIRVLLPAPLSPTSAVTWPGRTSRSTSCSTCTAPKLLLTPAQLSSGAPPWSAAGCRRRVGHGRHDTSPASVVSRWDGSTLGRGWPARRGPARPYRAGPPRPARTGRAWCRPPANVAGADLRPPSCKPSSMTSLTLSCVDPHRGGEGGRDVLVGCGVLDRAGGQGVGRACRP